MPHAAPALPQVAHRQAHVPEATGFELHEPQQLVRAALVLVALGGEPAQLLQAAGKPVARTLQLIQAKQRGAEAARLLAAGLRGVSLCARGRDIREAFGDDR